MLFYSSVKSGNAICNLSAHLFRKELKGMDAAIGGGGDTDIEYTDIDLRPAQEENRLG